MVNRPSPADCNNCWHATCYCKTFFLPYWTPAVSPTAATRALPFDSTGQRSALETQAAHVSPHVAFHHQFILLGIPATDDQVVLAGHEPVELLKPVGLAQVLGCRRSAHLAQLCLSLLLCSLQQAQGDSEVQQARNDCHSEVSRLLLHPEGSQIAAACTLIPPYVKAMLNCSWAVLFTACCKQTLSQIQGLSRTLVSEAENTAPHLHAALQHFVIHLSIRSPDGAGPHRHQAMLRLRWSPN